MLRDRSLDPLGRGLRPGRARSILIEHGPGAAAPSLRFKEARERRCAKSLRSTMRASMDRFFQNLRDHARSVGRPALTFHPFLSHP